MATKLKKEVWLAGGFGNILFQFLLIEKLVNLNYEVTVNKVLLKKNFITRILGWTIHDDLSDKILSKYPNIKIKNKPNIKDLYRLVIFIISKKISKNLLHHNFYSDFNQLKIQKNTFFMGYFQDQIFLQNYIDEMDEISKFIHNQYLITAQIKEIVFHFRWGDTNWGRKYSAYYDRVKSILVNKKEKIIIVTDDVEKANEIYGSIKNLEIKSSINPFDDFLLLLNAKTIFLSPSTFSWWAANLANNIEIIIYPKELKSFLPIIRNKNQANGI